ncbi:unnamed protein product [Pleuronectes platessa]|uniref:Secreted protein n=1 Tax=Pleuronectes platessa TaxID=8262 RepID=A0A9N7Y9Z8_PLEPL|nr:unnamed protein product [Pleuronectes platessa]
MTFRQKATLGVLRLSLTASVGPLGKSCPSEELSPRLPEISSLLHANLIRRMTDASSSSRGQIEAWGRIKSQRQVGGSRALLIWPVAAGKKLVLWREVLVLMSSSQLRSWEMMVPRK